MIYFWMGVIAVVAYCWGYLRGMFLMSGSQKQVEDYSKFLEEYDQLLNEKDIKKSDDQ